MKQKLLLFMVSVLFAVTTSTSQVWDMGTTSASWPIDLAQMPNGTQTIDGLTLNALGGTFGGMRAMPITTLTFSDGYAPVQEWQSQGNSQGTQAAPARRFISFPVDGASTIKVWFRVNGTGGRTCFVSDGTNVLGQATSESTSEGLIITASYAGPGAGTIYVSSSAAVNYYKIQVTAGALSLDDKTSPVSTNVKSTGSRVYVSNVKTASDISVYSITGALVKSFKTTSDVDFSLKTGLYIVTVKTIEGQKSVKLLVK